MPPLQLTVTSVATGGDGVARDDDGRVVFVAGVLPGEEVLADVVEERRDFARAQVRELLVAAPSRRVAPCPHVADGCGGCAWQHVGPSAQLDLKAGIVAEALRRIGRIPEPVVELGATLPADGFRTTLRMAVRDGRAAFRQARSHDVVEVDSCLVAHPLLAELAVEGRFGAAREVTLRAGARTGERLALVSPQAVDVQVPDDVLVVGADELKAGRRAWFHEEVAGRRWRISARSFFQARPDGADALVDAVVAAAGAKGGPGPGSPLVDLYAGVGLFAGSLGGDRPVTAVEWSASAVADARHNLASMRPRIRRTDVARWRPEPAGLVVADPARTGLGRTGVTAVAATGAARLVLVSCDPAALGRDAGLLREAGFEHAGSTLVDLFPHTPHIEAVSRFERIPAT